MTPEQAEDIFYETYREGQWKRVGEPIVQQELRRACWQAVINAIEAETLKNVAEQYLNKSEDSLT
jgi:hypothetical protein